MWTSSNESGKIETRCEKNAPLRIPSGSQYPSKGCQRGTPIHEARLANEQVGSKPSQHHPARVPGNGVLHGCLPLVGSASSTTRSNVGGTQRPTHHSAMCAFGDTDRVGSLFRSRYHWPKDRTSGLCTPRRTSHPLFGQQWLRFVLRASALPQRPYRVGVSKHTPRYSQHSQDQPLPFLSHLSVVDLLMNHGPASLEIIRRGRPVSL